MRLNAAWRIVAMLFALAAGCDRNESAKPAVPRPATVFGSAVVRGGVTLKGVPPVMPTIDNAACHLGAAKITEETIIASPSGGLANAVVYLKNAPPSANALPPVEMDQVDCRYTPHVRAVQVGQILRVKSSDPAIHNVHVTARRNKDANIAMMPGAKPVDLTFDAAEFLTLRCDVHPWMLAHVAVMDHPFFAVTDAQGKFEIPRVPDGSYTLAVWHEALGEREQSIVVTDGKTATADFVYEKPE